jgi:hypothetical protein
MEGDMKTHEAAPRPRFPVVLEALNERGLVYHQDPFGRPLATFSIPAEGTTFTVSLGVDETRFIAFCFAGPALRVPEPQRIRMAESITRANYGLGVGAFEMSFTDGEIRYRTEIDFDGGTLTTRMVNNMIGAAVVFWSRYLAAFSRVMAEEISPAEAMALAVGRGGDA